MKPFRYSVVLCEGYHDRAFWKGWLESHGWKDARVKPFDSKDPFGDNVAGQGKHAFYHGQDFVIVQPCSGISKMPQHLKHEVKEHHERKRVADKPFVAQIVVCVDIDSEDVPSEEDQLPMNAAEREQILREIPPAERCEVRVVRWQVTSAYQAAGVPKKQTLERLACAALCRAYPERAEKVSQWLEGLSPEALHKAHAWSYMAGWHADQGCEAFYTQLWQDEKTRKILIELLKAGGNWEAFAMLSDAPQNGGF